MLARLSQLALRVVEVLTPLIRVIVRAVYQTFVAVAKRRDFGLCYSHGGLLLLRIMDGLDQALLGLLPVDNGPHLLEVARAAVLVVKVISVLPDVDVDDGHKVGAHVLDQVLVCRGAEGQ